MAAATIWLGLQSHNQNSIVWAFCEVTWYFKHTFDILQHSICLLTMISTSSKDTLKQFLFTSILEPFHSLPYPLRQKIFPDYFLIFMTRTMDPVQLPQILCRLSWVICCLCVVHCRRGPRRVVPAVYELHQRTNVDIENWKLMNPSGCLVSKYLEIGRYGGCTSTCGTTLRSATGPLDPVFIFATAPLNSQSYEAGWFFCWYCGMERQVDHVDRWNHSTCSGTLIRTYKSAVNLGHLAIIIKHWWMSYRECYVQTGQEVFGTHLLRVETLKVMAATEL